jgi:hypothetical protein
MISQSAAARKRRQAQRFVRRPKCLCITRSIKSTGAIKMRASRPFSLEVASLAAKAGARGSAPELHTRFGSVVLTDDVPREAFFATRYR